MERINVRVDACLKRQLEAEASEKGVTASDIVRQVHQEHMRKRQPRESCLDVARRSGILFVYRNGPSDLSTNAAHMEGSGRE